MSENATNLDLQKALAHFEKKVSDYQLYVDKCLIEMKQMMAEWLPTLKGETGEAGADGSNGKSAFQIALDTGFSGTEAEWLNSLKGLPGKDGTDGKNVVVFDTNQRSYPLSKWQGYITDRTNTDWGDVKNRSNFKPGDIGIMIGMDSTNNAPVLLIGEITEITEYMVWMTSLALMQGPKGPQGPQGPKNEVKYYKFRDQTVNFGIERGKIYSFTVKDEDTNSVYIVDKDGNTITGVAGKTLNGMKSGLIMSAERCSISAMTGELSITNLNPYIADRWDWDDGSKSQYGPYFIKTSSASGIDIWEY